MTPFSTACCASAWESHASAAAQLMRRRAYYVFLASVAMKQREVRAAQRLACCLKKRREANFMLCSDGSSSTGTNQPSSGPPLVTNGSNARLSERLLPEVLLKHRLNMDSYYWFTPACLPDVRSSPTSALLDRLRGCPACCSQCLTVVIYLRVTDRLHAHRPSR